MSDHEAYAFHAAEACHQSRYARNYQDVYGRSKCQSARRDFLDKWRHCSGLARKHARKALEIRLNFL